MMDYIFTQKIQIFYKKDKETKISTTALNNGEPWDLKSKNFKVTYITAPLKFHRTVLQNYRRSAEFRRITQISSADVCRID